VPDTAEAGPSQSTASQAAAAQPGLVDRAKGTMMENVLVGFTIVTGLLAFATGWVVSLHSIATVLAVASMVVGLYAQLVSTNRDQRIVIVTGLVAAFVGGALAIAHGGVG
jgi:predicted lipid-binding transport protein (Tim44 family)